MVVGYRNLGGVIKLTPDDARLAKFKTMLKLHLPKQVCSGLGMIRNTTYR